MTSKRHNDTEALLDAAQESVLAVGVRRTTLTDVARRAGVSRMTIYRRWPDITSLVADLMTREFVNVVVTASPGTTGGHVTAEVVRSLRSHPLWRKIVEVDPELLLPYLVDRRGSTHERVLAHLERTLADGQATGRVRPGDTALMARSVLLAAQSWTLSAATMTGPVSLDRLDDELALLIDRYLAP